MIHRLVLVVLALAAAGAGAIAGCGDDDHGETGVTATGAVGGGGAGAGGSTGSGGGAGQVGGGGDGGSATVQFSASVFDQALAPIDAAGVALDLASGTRLEGWTDAQGLVVFELPADDAIDHLIAHKDGYSFFSYPGAALAGASEGSFLLAQAPGPTTLVEISGTGLGMHDPASDFLWVLASGGTWFSAEGTDAYTVLVEPGQPFTLIGQDVGAPIVNGQDIQNVVYSTVVTTHPAVSQPTVLDIDFATPTPHDATFNASLALPADAVLASTGVASIVVQTEHLWAGGASSCVRSGSAFDCSGETWDVGDFPAFTLFRITQPGEPTAIYFGREVSGFMLGGPSPGLMDLDFPNPPDISAPTGPGPHPVDGVARFTVAEGGGSSEPPMGQIQSLDGRLIGLMVPSEHTPAGEPTEYEISLPSLPSTSDAAACFEDSMQMLVFNCRAASGYCNETAIESWEASRPAQ